MDQRRSALACYHSFANQARESRSPHPQHLGARLESSSVQDLKAVEVRPRIATPDESIIVPNYHESHTCCLCVQTTLDTSQPTLTSHTTYQKTHPYSIILLQVLPQQRRMPDDISTVLTNSFSSGEKKKGIIAVRGFLPVRDFHPCWSQTDTLSKSVLWQHCRYAVIPQMMPPPLPNKKISALFKYALVQVADNGGRFEGHSSPV